MIDLAVLDAIAAAGASGVVVVAAVKAMVSNPQIDRSVGGPAVAVVQQTPPRSAAAAPVGVVDDKPTPLSGAERTRRWRARGDVTVTASPSPSQSVTHQPIVLELNSSTTACVTPDRHEICAEEERKKEREIDGSARAEFPKPRSLITAEAMALADDVCRAVGVDPANPELAGMSGAAYSAAMWLERGYDRARILAKVANIGPGYPLTYYSRAVEKDHRQRPPPIVAQPDLPFFPHVIRSGETTHAPTGRDRNVQARPTTHAERAAFYLRRAAEQREQAASAG